MHMKNKKRQIIIELPPDFFWKVNTLLDWLEIPPVRLTAEMQSIVLSDQWITDWSLWISGYCYPDRAAAVRVAWKIFKRRPRCPEIEIFFREKGAQAHVVFVNPNRLPMTPKEQQAWVKSYLAIPPPPVPRRELLVA